MDELDRLVDIGYRMKQESPVLRYMDFDREKTAAFILSAIHGAPDTFLRVIATDDDVAVGGMLCVVTPTYFGADHVAEDRILLLEPEHRGSCIQQLQEIVGQYVEWARVKGARVVVLATTTGIERDKTKMLFEFMGFPCVGTTHVLIAR